MAEGRAGAGPNDYKKALASVAVVCSAVMAGGLGDGVMAASTTPAGSLALPAEVVEQRLQALPEWSLEQQTLVTLCEFTDFVETVAFVNQLVEPAERLGHHPDLEIAYNRLTIRLTTHDAAGLTTLDLDLAKAISALAWGHCQPIP